ncbi:MAG: nicotinate-nucleotide--dimethylbenzimidazole phosphoribosyltransferase [Alphaproteobacteria bacterium]|nr:nicotinate-nucleotide--dimethylbenzimidazole phosphoribosyltransferase [Alphaproteobacteria bacterium]
MTDAAQSATIQEIKDLMQALPGPDQEAEAAVRARDATLTKPPGALGRLEEIAAWMAAWQGRAKPRLDRPRVAVFAANHGVAAAHPVSAFPTTVTAQMVENFRQGGAAVNQLCAAHDAELRIYEMALDSPTADFTVESAMDDPACATALAYGMMAVEEGVDLICLGEMGIGNTTSAAAVCHALYGETAAGWTGPGTGVEGDALKAKADVVAKAVAVNKAEMTDGFEILRCVGGFELAAICGAVIAARMGRVPVLLDGYVSTAAAAVLQQVRPDALDHCLIAHRSAEPAHAALIQELGKEPLLDLGMRLGEGSGAVTALPLIRSAVACHNGMASFGDAGVSGAV